jgi:hypothetical protein
MHAGVKTSLKTAGRVAPFGPVLGGASTYLTGRADAATRTADVKNPVTIAVAGLSWVGAIGSAVMGWTLPAIGLSTVATATVSALTHDVGVAAGESAGAKG